MIRPVILGLVAAIAATTAVQAQTTTSTTTTTTTTTAAAVYSSTTTPIGDLLDNPATKAVLLKWIPDVVNDPRIDQGRTYTLADIVQYVPALTPAMLANIDADLAKVPHS